MPYNKTTATLGVTLPETVSPGTTLTGNIATTSGTTVGMQLLPTYNSTGTSASTDIQINRTETAVGSGSQLFLDCQVGGVSKFSVDNTGAPTFAGGITGAVTLGQRVTPANALTAVGTNRATSLALTADTNVIATALSGTGVTLPAATVGRRVRIYNNGANAITIYGAGSDTIDTIAAATGVTLTNALRCEYECVAASTWISAQLGVVSA